MRATHEDILHKFGRRTETTSPIRPTRRNHISDSAYAPKPMRRSPSVVPIST